MKALGVLRMFFGFNMRIFFLLTVFGVIACARTDFQAFDEYDESAGESGTGTGGRSNGGTSAGGVAGTSFTGGVAGTTFTGGSAGTGGAVCRESRELCGNECVFTDRDPRHCGGCFNLCPDYTECIEGECIPLCDGSTYCNGICTDITRDPRNCGGCGYDCPPNTSCRNGYCTTFCDEGFIRCGGACVDWMNDPMNCGGCGYSCPPGQFCGTGFCQLECPPGLTLCGNQCRDLRTDVNNCGACGRACGSREFCSSGMCVPRPGMTTYSVGPSPLTFVTACGQPGAFEVLADLDDEVMPLMLPFQFRFYNQPAVVAWASSNGILGFGQSTADFQNACSGLSVSLAIMAFWDDLATRQRGVCVATLGVSPNRQFVATWNDAYILGIPATHLTFSVVLNEGSNVVDVLYSTMTGAGALSAGQDATIGLASEREYALDCCNQACVMSNTGRRYTPVL